MSRDERSLFETPPEIEDDRASSFRDDVALARGAGDLEREKFLASPTSARIAERLRAAAQAHAARERITRRRRVAWWSAASVALAAGIAAIVVVPWAGDTPSRPRIAPGVDPDIRLKGGTSLLVARKRGAGAEPVLDGARLSPGDRLRFVCTTSRAYAMIVNVEARGHVHAFYPFPAGASVRLETTGDAGTPRRATLGGSIELDANLGEERIIGVFSDAPFGFEHVAAAVERAYPVSAGGRRDLGSLRDLPLDADVVQVRIVKERAR